MWKIKINCLFLLFIFDILKFRRIVTGRRAFLKLLSKSIGYFSSSSNNIAIIIFNMVQYLRIIFAGYFLYFAPDFFNGCVAVDRRYILSPTSTFLLFYCATTFSSNKLSMFNILIIMIFFTFSISSSSLFYYCWNYMADYIRKYRLR